MFAAVARAALHASWARYNCNCRLLRLPLASQVVDLDALRELCWSGVPADLRPICWRLLSGYLPPNRERR